MLICGKTPNSIPRPEVIIPRLGDLNAERTVTSTLSALESSNAALILLTSRSVSALASPAVLKILMGFMLDIPHPGLSSHCGLGLAPDLNHFRF